MTGGLFLSLTLEEEYQNSIDLFRDALSLAKKHLVLKKRLAGDSYFEHNVRVASTLIDNKSEPNIVATAILRRILNYVPREEISQQFGNEILHLLEGVEELQEIKDRNVQLKADALGKIILATLHDPRVILIKLAVKLDNLASLHVFPPKIQQRVAEDVLEIYAPLAYRLGIERIRVKLEDLAFSIINPEKFREISNFLEESREQRQKNIEAAIGLIRNICEGNTQIDRIKGRPKHIYSIYKKMQDKGVKLNDQYDHLGIRIIVSEVRDCYTLLGLLHENFESISGRLKDYIANPKPNFYRSLHTGILLPSGKMAEIQIRTPEMDQFAEEGLAAHWRYKGIKSDQLFEKKIAWLRGVLDLQKITQTEYMDRVDIFGDKIYCYTPKGDVKELPRGASLLDFAFMVHEEIGSKTMGGRVNGKFVPIKHLLNSGDVVEIITNKNQRPRRSWLKVVYSARAKQKIRKALKKHEKLPALHYRVWKPVPKDEQGVLTVSEAFPRAVCMLAKCCRALPGVPIVGIVTKRRIISVHSEGCREALKQRDRWVPVQWRDTFNQKISFVVEASERSGLLADLIHTVATAGFEVKEAKGKLLGTNAECSFSVIPRDLMQIQDLIQRVQKVQSIRRIYFE